MHYNAIPVLGSLSDCASYEVMFGQFRPQLEQLPSRFLQTWRHLEDLKQLYLATNPMITALWFALLLSVVFFLASRTTGNVSQVDRSWSILPTCYNAHYWVWAFGNGLPMQRLNTLLALSIAWSIRLTFNYWRKGGYSYGSEDYRWNVLRKYIPPLLFIVFDVLFIALAQMILLMAVTLPTYVLLVATTVLGDEMQWADLAAPWVVMSFILLCFFGDQQQWEYHEAKEQYKKTAKPVGGYSIAQLERGFNTRDLWAYSRHPNFAGEQGVWISYYVWSCAATGNWYSWAGVGTAMYLALFYFSTMFSEWITNSKYPEYKEYKRLTGKFVPGISSITSLRGYDEFKAAEQKKTS